jgi:hypothetical protein
MKTIKAQSEVYKGESVYIHKSKPYFKLVSKDKGIYHCSSCRAYAQDFFFFFYNSESKERSHSAFKWDTDLSKFSFLVLPKDDIKGYLASLRKSLKDIAKTFGVKGYGKTEIVKLIGSNKVEQEIIQITPNDFWKNTPEALSLFTLICRTRAAENGSAELNLINVVIKNKEVFLDHNLNKRRTWECEQSKIKFNTSHHDEGISLFLHNKKLV